MNVCLDYQAFAMQKYGGVSRYYVELFNRLNGYSDCDVTIIAPLYINKLIQKTKYHEKIIGKEVAEYPKTYELRKYLNNILSEIICRRSKFDIYHETYYSKFAVRSKKRKCVTTVHDMINERFCSSIKNSKNDRKNKFDSINRADLVFCNSENTKRDLLEVYPLSNKNIVVTYLSCDYQSTVVDVTDGTRIIEPEYILYVGSRGGYKNFNNLLDVYASNYKVNRWCKLVVFGSTLFTKKELTKMDYYGIKDKVLMMSGSDDVLSNLYKNANLFIYPSLYEGFGIPLLEAMANGCPVACSNTSSFPEVVGNAAVMFNPYDKSEINDAIDSVLFNNQKKVELISAGKERVKLFSWEKCAKQTYEAYKTLF